MFSAKFSLYNWNKKSRHDMRYLGLWLFLPPEETYTWCSRNKEGYFIVRRWVWETIIRHFFWKRNFWLCNQNTSYGTSYDTFYGASVTLYVKIQKMPFSFFWDFHALPCQTNVISRKTFCEKLIILKSNPPISIKFVQTVLNLEKVFTLFFNFTYKFNKVLIKIEFILN